MKLDTTELYNIRNYIGRLLASMWVTLLGRVRAHDAPYRMSIITGDRIRLDQYYETFLFTTTAPSANALEDGYDGQVVELALEVDGGDLVITPDHFKNGTTITLGDAGDMIVLRFCHGAWYVVSNYGAVIA